MNAESSRSHAIVTIHFDSWASSGSKEDADAEQGEKLYDLIEKARQVKSDAQGRACTHFARGIRIMARSAVRLLALHAPQCGKQLTAYSVFRCSD